MPNPNERIPALDIARGLTVLFIPAIHTAVLYSTPGFRATIIGDLLAFMAEGPGAQLFMLLMGVGIVFSHRISKEYVFKRALYMIAAAYILNLLKFIVPFLLGGLPPAFIMDMGLSNDASALLPLLLTGDILQFAAIAYIMIYLVSQLKQYHYWAMGLAVMVICLSPLVWDIETGLPMTDYVLRLLGGHPPGVFFPVFPWLVYPLAGLALGYYLKEYQTAHVMRATGWVGGELIVLAFFFPADQPVADWLPFYRSSARDTLLHLGLVLLWLGFIYSLTEQMKPNKLTRLFSFCSKHITVIYVVQWLLIFWCLPLAGYQQLNSMGSIGWMIFNTAITLLLTRLYTKWYATQQNL